MLSSTKSQGHMASNHLKGLVPSNFVCEDEQDMLTINGQFLWYNVDDADDTPLTTISRFETVS